LSLSSLRHLNALMPTTVAFFATAYRPKLLKSARNSNCWKPTDSALRNFVMALRNSVIPKKPKIALLSAKPLVRGVGFEPTEAFARGS